MTCSPRDVAGGVQGRSQLEPHPRCPPSALHPIPLRALQVACTLPGKESQDPRAHTPPRLLHTL